MLLQGFVQGLGVRPALYRLATQCRLFGVIRNTAKGVHLHLEGSHAGLEQFRRNLCDALPAGAKASQIWEAQAPWRGHREISIETSSHEPLLAASVPPDLAVCGACLAEIRDPDDRRYRYPFTSCCACGPRYTIIRAMPYERHDTSMAEFPMCGNCQTEYNDPSNRRFHAQTNACPVCGPRVWCVENLGGPKFAESDDAVRATAEALRSGRVVAVRGIGGYQLLVDATQDQAVRRLRAAKGRPAKPLAVLVRSLEEADSLASLDALERTILADVTNPIVQVQARDGMRLSASIHPGLNTIGLMLPTTPLHQLLADAVARPLVCTSGNREGEPLVYEVLEAELQLNGICDLWLHHDRPIERPIDDSVVRAMAGRRVVLRLARGLAPLPLPTTAGPPSMAVGGFQKCAVAWSNGQQCVLGPHLGDLESAQSRQRFVDHIADMQQLYHVAPEVVYSDRHPDFPSTQWAQAQSKLHVVVQHHQAHLLAAMIDRQGANQAALGVAWDGTGLGVDETIWGGEFFVCREGGLTRVASLRPFPLPGGEAAIHEPWRVAVAIAGQIDMESIDPAVRQFMDELSSDFRIGKAKLAAVGQLVDRPHLSPTTTSTGRLFDAAAAIIVPTRFAQFDGQPAMLLEAAAAPDASGDYPFPLVSAQHVPWQLDWRPLFQAILTDHAAHIPREVIAMRFHRSLANGIRQVGDEFPDLPIYLSGGVFQNRLLVELIAHLLPKDRWFIPEAIPPNDGGLAAGQLASHR